MAVLLVAPEIFIPLRRAGAEFHASTEGQAAAARVLEVLDTPAPTEAATRRRVVTRGAPEPAGPGSTSMPCRSSTSTGTALRSRPSPSTPNPGRAWR